MQTVGDIIDSFGGNSTFARVLGLKGASTASEMRRRGSIPGEYWHQIATIAASQGIKGVDLPALARIAAARRAAIDPIARCSHCGADIAGKAHCANADCPVLPQAKAEEAA